MTQPNTPLELSPDEISRYSRHIILPKVGLAGQVRIKKSKILIVGLGGLGGPVAYYLAAAGVGTIGLADYDRVEAHNLQRQIIHTTPEIGVAKVSSAKEKLEALNPHCRIRLHGDGITLENALDIFSQYDLVVDGSDNFPTRYLVNDAAFLARKPLVYGSIFQFEGQVSLFDPTREGPCYRCLFPHMPEPGSVPNCAEAGVFGALCGTIGSLQAMEAIKYFVGTGQSLKGRLLVMDAFNMQVRTLNLKKDPACPLCGEQPSITSLVEDHYIFSCETQADDDPPGGVGLSPSQSGEEIPEEIDIDEARSWIDKGKPSVLLDVREPYEVAVCNLPESRNIPMGQIPPGIDAFSQDDRILVYCHHGMRSLQVVRYMRGRGFTRTTSMRGGIDLWAQRFDPAMRRY